MRLPTDHHCVEHFAERALGDLWDRQTGSIECWRRSNHGKLALHPVEIEAHLGNYRRAAQLALERVRAELPNVRDVELSSGVWNAMRDVPGPMRMERVPGAKVLLSTVSEHEFELCIQSRVNAQKAIGGQVIKVPFGLLREARATSDRKIGLFLRVRVLHQFGKLTLDPF